MGQAKRTAQYDVDVHKLYKVIIDYPSYPSFVDGVSSIQVLSQSDTDAKVEYSLNVIKTFKYIINTQMKKESDKSYRIQWSLDSGDLFKKNNGSWFIQEISPGKTEVTYELEVDLKMFAPSSILTALTNKNLPAMMDSFAKKAQ